jgi:hypothetical protein
LAAESGGAGLLIILSGLFLAAGMSMGGLGVLLAVSLHSLTD